MDIKSRIKALIKEAELYRSQGLLNEAKGKYSNAAKLIQQMERLANKQDLLDGISKKIAALERDINKLEQAPVTREMSTKVQDLIKKLFSFSKEKDKDAAELEGAIALARFGQFDRALTEFNELIKIDSLRVDAAKNILRCHIASSSPDDAVAKYQHWFSSDIFPKQQLEKIRVFLQDILDRKGIDKTLPADTKPTEVQGVEIPEEELLDISLIEITLEQGPNKGTQVELDVNFQKGNMLSLIIQSKDIDLLESLEVGARLNNIQFSSSIAIFQGMGIVSSKTQIGTGPRNGDYMLDIEVQDV